MTALPSPPQYARHDLPAAVDGDLPHAPAAAGDHALEVFRGSDALAVDGQDHVALLETDALRHAAVLDLGESDAVRRGFELHLVGDGRRYVDRGRAREGRARAELHGLARPRFGRRLQLHGQHEPLAAAQDGEARLAVDAIQGVAVAERLGIVDALAVDGQDHVAALDAGFVRRLPFEGPRPQAAPWTLKPHRLGDLVADALKAGAEPGPAHRAVPAAGGVHHSLDHAGRDREPDAMAAARLREYGGVDADQAARHVDERTARVARIDGRVGLDEELIIRHANLRAGERRHDALRHRLADAERVADREHEIADLERLRITELDRGRALGAFHSQNRKVGARVAQHDLGLELPPVREGDLHLGHVLDDVVVRHHEARAVHHDPGAERALAAVLRHARRPIAEEAAEELVGVGAAPPLVGPRAIDVDDRGRDLPDHGREGELNL